MQRFLDKWGLWIALVVVGSIITYGIVAGSMKTYDEPGKGANKAAAPAPAKAFD
jgi:hypothetical protein